MGNCLEGLRTSSQQNILYLYFSRMRNCLLSHLKQQGKTRINSINPTPQHSHWEVFWAAIQKTPQCSQHRQAQQHSSSQHIQPALCSSSAHHIPPEADVWKEGPLLWNKYSANLQSPELNSIPDHSIFMKNKSVLLLNYSQLHYFVGIENTESKHKN